MSCPRSVVSCGKWARQLPWQHRALFWLPWVLIVLVGTLVVLRYRESLARPSLLGKALLYLPVIGLLGYWGMLW